MRAPATGKAREPMEVRRTARTIRSSKVEDRSLRREGTRQKHTQIAAVYVVRRRSEHGTSGRQSCTHARSQCKLTNASVMWSERRSRYMKRAAAFWTDWRRDDVYNRFWTVLGIGTDRWTDRRTDKNITSISRCLCWRLIKGIIRGRYIWWRSTKFLHSTKCNTHMGVDPGGTGDSPKRLKGTLISMYLPENSVCYVHLSIWCCDIIL